MLGISVQKIYDIAMIRGLMFTYLKAEVNLESKSRKQG